MGAMRNKQIGNEALKAQRIEGALHEYRCGIERLSFMKTAEPILSGRMKEQVKQLQGDLHNNMALCCVKQEDWEGAIDHASKTIELHPQNVKALFRRGVAHAGLNNQENARKDLSRAMELDPKNHAARQE